MENGERRAAELLRRSVAVDASDPDLAETLKTAAITLSLRDESINDRIDKIQSAHAATAAPPAVVSVRGRRLQWGRGGCVAAVVCTK